MGKFTIFKKPRFCPNAQGAGFSGVDASVGDLVVFESLPDAQGGTRDQLGRVLGQVNELDNGERPDGTRLVLLVANDSLNFGYERYVPLDRIRKVVAPGDFARFFLFGEMPRPEVAIDAIRYGAMNDRIGRYLDDGKLRPTFKNRDRVGDGYLSARCPKCGGPVHPCGTGDPGCLHCDDGGCGWNGFLEDDGAGAPR